MDKLPGVTFNSLYQVVLRLTAKDGCPWDSTQTVVTLIPKFEEECAELRKAVQESDYVGIGEELGDLLYLVCLSTATDQHQQLDMETVIENVRDKMILKHPVLFPEGLTTVGGADGLVPDGSASVQGRTEKAKWESRFRWDRRFCPEGSGK